MSITTLIIGALQVYTVALLVWVVASWLPQLRRQPALRPLGRICEPYLGLFRRVLPPMGGIDASPILAIVALQLLARLAARLPF